MFTPGQGILTSPAVPRSRLTHITGQGAEGGGSAAAPPEAGLAVGGSKGSGGERGVLVRRRRGLMRRWRPEAGRGQRGARVIQGMEPG